jgi:hypothetical protein
MNGGTRYHEIRWNVKYPGSGDYTAVIVATFRSIASDTAAGVPPGPIAHRRSFSASRPSSLVRTTVSEV